MTGPLVQCMYALNKKSWHHELWCQLFLKREGSGINCARHSWSRSIDPMALAKTRVLNRCAYNIDRPRSHPLKISWWVRGWDVRKSLLDIVLPCVCPILNDFLLLLKRSVRKLLIINILWNERLTCQGSWQYRFHNYHGFYQRNNILWNFLSSRIPHGGIPQ